jgi:hypothetical protein
LIYIDIFSLGITVLGGENSKRLDRGIYVKSVTEGGVAARDGRLKAGKLHLGFVFCLFFSKCSRTPLFIAVYIFLITQFAVSMFNPTISVFLSYLAFIPSTHYL